MASWISTRKKKTMLQGDGVGRRKRERPPEEVPSEQVAMKAGSNLVGRAHAQEGGANALGHQGDQWTGVPSEERSRAGGDKGDHMDTVAMAGLGLSRGKQDIITEWLWASEQAHSP